MSVRDSLRAGICERLVEKALSEEEAAGRLGLSVRQVRRLKRRVKEEGPRGVIHRSRGQPSPRRISETVQADVVRLYRATYTGWNMVHFGEYLASRHGITLSPETLRKMLLAEEARPRRRRRKQHRQWRERTILDTGTTTLAMARELRERDGMSVVTTNLAIVSELLHSPGIECMLLGGMVRESTPDLYGPLLEDNLSRIHTDRAFIGCDGISEAGVLMTNDPRVARASALMIENSAQVVLLADSSKAKRNSFISFGTLGQLDCLITDDRMPADILGVAREAGVETILVNSEEKQGR